MAEMTKGVPNKPGVWYKIHVEECPLCCHTEEYRERRKGPKPKSPQARYSFTPIAYHCGYL